MKLYKKSILVVYIALAILLVNCTTTTYKTNFPDSELQHYCVQKLTDVIVYDIVNPPVASRMYAYTNIAYYEALSASDKNSKSLTSSLKGFKKIDAPNRNNKYDFRLSAVVAFMKVAESLVFSKDSIRKARAVVMEAFASIDDNIKENSIQWGEKVATQILERASNDGYKITRGMPKFSVLKETGIWEQTPPDYEEAVEPNWRYIQPLLLDSAAQFKPVRPPAFSMDSSTQYYKEVKEIYDLSKSLTNEQKLAARFWDDNPFVSEHKGHLTYATKKTTPVGHWMGITTILSRRSQKNESEIALTYALTAAAIFDGFISTWEEKYTSKTVRPVTVIRQYLSSEWEPLLQTPPFPEYTSGHSVISAAAATILSHSFGKATPFHDTTEIKYLGLERSFSSIEMASEEVSLSRMYGGIHYRSAVINGQKQGKNIGNYYINKIYIFKST